MNKTSYAQKLLDPRWQKKRLEVLDAADWACEVCGDAQTTLHVHHKQYIKGREPWEYDKDQLAALCKCCHDTTHGAHDILMDVVSRLPIDGMKWIDRGKAAALLAGAMGLENFAADGDVAAAWFNAGLRVQELADAEHAALTKQGRRHG